MVDYSKALAVAVDAAREAGAMLRDEFHRPGGPRGDRAHADIDEKVERLIRQRLLSELPWGFRGEELGFTEGASDSHIWLVDPHDGTSLFLSGRRGSAVSVAALRGGVPVLGVVYAFCYPDDRGDLICWAEGCGPILRNGRPVKADALAATSGTAAGDVPIVLLWAAADRTVLAAMRCVHPARFAACPSIAYRLALASAGEAAAAVVDFAFLPQFPEGIVAAEGVTETFVVLRADPEAAEPVELHVVAVIRTELGHESENHNQGGDPDGPFLHLEIPSSNGTVR